MIKVEIEAEGKASLVTILGRLDFQKTVVPSDKEFNLAFSDLRLSMTKIHNDILLEADDASTQPVKIGKHDLESIFRTYIELLRS